MSVIENGAKLYYTYCGNVHAVLLANFLMLSNETERVLRNGFFLAIAKHSKFDYCTRLHSEFKLS